MASVYKALSKKKTAEAPNTLEANEDVDRDIPMEDLLEDNDDTSDSEDEEGGSTDDEQAQDGGVAGFCSKSQSASYMPKTRVLMLTSRGVTHRHRHLLSDLTSLLPHTHKESKLDTKKKSAGYNFLLNSLAELHACNVIFFLEARKHGQDLYLWLARPPNGPTIKFAVSNLHTMGELGTGFMGNCLKGGRGIVVFDRSFDEQTVLSDGNEWRGLVREMLRSVFCVPKRRVRRMKPFVDRIIGVFGVDGKIWIRVFEIRESERSKGKAGEKEGEIDNKTQKTSPSSSKSKGGLPDISLVEIGPRFVLTPIVILEGSFGGPVIYENREFVSPNQVRREIRIKRAGRYISRQTEQTDRMIKKAELGLGSEGEKRKEDVLDSRVLFA